MTPVDRRGPKPVDQEEEQVGHLPPRPDQQKEEGPKRVYRQPET